MIENNEEQEEDELFLLQCEKTFYSFLIMFLFLCNHTRKHTHVMANFATIFEKRLQQLLKIYLATKRGSALRRKFSKLISFPVHALHV